jgi:hypothetical protein
LSLKASRKHHRTMLLLPPLDALHRQAIHLVTANARKVRIDGLVVGRR